MQRRKGAAAKGQRWTALVLLALVAGCLWASIVWAHSWSDATGAAVVVDGVEIAEQELLLHMDGHRALVADEYRRQYGAQMDAGFWSRHYDGGTPTERLRAVAGEQAARALIERRIAQEAGVVEDISYAAILAALETENERRAAAVAAGQVIYGPMRFEASTFYSYYRSGLRNAAIESLMERGELADSDKLAPHLAYEALVDRRLAAARLTWKTSHRNEE